MIFLKFQWIEDALSVNEFLRLKEMESFAQDLLDVVIVKFQELIFMKVSHLSSTI